MGLLVERRYRSEWEIGRRDRSTRAMFPENASDTLTQFLYRNFDTISVVWPSSLPSFASVRSESTMHSARNGNFP